VGFAIIFFFLFTFFVDFTNLEVETFFDIVRLQDLDTKHLFIAMGRESACGF
jgi:hypothetical protein